MAENVQIDFTALKDAAAAPKGRGAKAQGGTLVVLAGSDLAMADGAKALLGDAADLVKRAAATAKFKGASGSALDILAPAGLAFDRLMVIGTAKKPAKDSKDAKPAAPDYVSLGGAIMGKIGGAARVTVAFDLPEAPEDAAAAAADAMLGMRLRAYKFDLYKTKKSDDDDKGDVRTTVSLAVQDPAAAKREAKSREAIAEGVTLARTLVNEPPNVLFPAAFADRAKELQKLGVEVEVLGEKELAKLGFRALLGVGQGSDFESKVVIMRWNGAKGAKGDKAKPVAFVGKGVCFDTGGISIKPAGGMEDMKGDMAGAACVVGLMHALAARKAKVNAIGAIGIVENMPDGKAQRPGDIVKSLSGQTIEIINTDAEGRLVLADVLWYVQDKYKPRFMVNLATLTGAILVALGTEYAGLFSNDDELSGLLSKAGDDTGEKVWRMPLGPNYDKLLDSKFADMKHVGGRHAGSITAAQFLQRFVNGVPWAHLDIAGTGMSSPASDINQSWGSGWGVRLLDRLVADHYES
jgi:leucyl aminopeptidase